MCEDLRGDTVVRVLKKQPVYAALLLVGVYALWFALPYFFITPDPNTKGIVGIAGALKQANAERITAGVLLAYIGLLGWWREVGFVRVKRGGWKFLFPILLLVVLILGIALAFSKESGWFLGCSGPAQLLQLLGVMLLLGFVEEGIFRGVLFYGLSTRLTPFFTVLVTALVFGAFHMVNVLVGAPVDAAFFQSIHAFAMGFLYASLRLRLGAVWPLMILHALWDFSLFVMQTTLHVSAPNSGEATLLSALIVAAPAMLYGIFVYYRWRVWHRKTRATLRK